jgi:hypothetical protein
MQAGRSISSGSGRRDTATMSWCHCSIQAVMTVASYTGNRSITVS